jgi:hypothetical protein
MTNPKESAGFGQIHSQETFRDKGISRNTIEISMPRVGRDEVPICSPEHHRLVRVAIKRHNRSADRLGHKSVAHMEHASASYNTNDLCQISPLTTPGYDA